ncbi:uncharacterized protein LOC115994137 isoform X7 [Quercus lobata]|uniref:uncharacterized protein LOC115994137 isoform X7 n=1 Tax=Quercus lobata TaxID=97700 RepID=UPI001245044F|nr:uncharacterized protein LOC115994137 isoform X7 [Quercus lobata]
MALSLTTIRLCSWPWPSRDRFATTSAEICWSVIECFREEGRDGDKSKVLVAMLKETVDLRNTYGRRTERKKRGEEEEKRDTGSRNFRGCCLFHHKSQRNGHGRDPSHKSQTLRILC